MNQAEIAEGRVNSLKDRSRFRGSINPSNKILLVKVAILRCLRSGYGRGYRRTDLGGRIVIYVTSARNHDKMAIFCPERTKSTARNELYLMF